MTVLANSLRASSLLLALILVVAAAGCHQVAPPPEEEEHPQAPVQAVAAQEVVMGEWADLFGTTLPLPNRSARVSTTVEGHVLSVLGDGNGPAVVEGQRVEKGQVIVQMDDRVLRATRAKLQATLDELKEHQKQAGYAVELATIDVNRLRELSQGGSTGGAVPLVSKVELEKAVVMQKDARSKMKAGEDKDAAARADLKAVDEQLKFYTLRAPIAGRLGIVNAVPGQTLSPGTVVADVVDLDQIDVLCYSPPAVAARLALGQRAKLSLEETASADAKDAIEGKIAYIAVQSQPETGNVAVKVRFPNPDLRLRANAVVRVFVLTRPEQKRLTIPEAAVMEDLEVPTVVAAVDVETEKKGDEEVKLGKARKLHAALGVRDRDRRVVEILGLEDPATKEKVDPRGVLFVTEGGHGLQDKDVVEVRNEEKKEEK
jgi:RND family efflux transporter MFP subunit